MTTLYFKGKRKDRDKDIERGSEKVSQPKLSLGQYA